MHEIRLPELGEGIEKAVIAFWHCKKGDAVHQGDEVAEVVTDKASFNISSEVSGLVKEICFEVGQEVTVGSTLAVLELKN